MNEEEYLKAAGWKQSIDQWSREWGDAADWMPLAEAVEAQLAEDRARYNFMRERSEWRGGVLVPLADKSDDCKGAER